MAKAKELADNLIIKKYEDLTIGAQVSLAGAKYLVQLDQHGQKFFQGPGQDTDIPSLAVQSFFAQGGQVEQLKDAAPDPKVWVNGDHVLDADGNKFVCKVYAGGSFLWLELDAAPTRRDEKMRRPLVHVASTVPVVIP